MGLNERKEWKEGQIAERTTWKQEQEKRMESRKGKKGGKKL